MLDYYTGKVRIIERTFKRTLKDGTPKEYKTIIKDVSLPKEANFLAGETVAVLYPDKISELEKKYNTNLDELRELRAYRENMVIFQDIINNYQKNNNNLSEQVKTLNNELNDCKNFIIAHRLIIEDFKHLSLLDRLRGRVPGSYKKIKA